MAIVKETDLPEHLGYQVQRLGNGCHTTKKMDSIRIEDRRTWKRYSNGTGGDAITFLLEFNGQRARDSSASSQSSGGCLPIFKRAASPLGDPQLYGIGPAV